MTVRVRVRITYSSTLSSNFTHLSFRDNCLGTSSLGRQQLLDGGQVPYSFLLNYNISASQPYVARGLHYVVLEAQRPSFQANKLIAWRLTLNSLQDTCMVLYSMCRKSLGTS